MTKSGSTDIFQGTSSLEVQDLLVDLINALSAIKSLSEISCEHIDEKALTKKALYALIHNQDIERCSFFILDAEGMLMNVAGLSIHELSAAQAWQDEPLRFGLGVGIIGSAAASGVRQYCSNCREDPRFAVFEDQRYIPGSLISIPVFSLYKALIGVLNVSHPDVNYFTQWHLRLLGIFADILGQLLTNQRLFQQMEQQIALRTSELERQMLEAQSLKEHYASMSMHDQLTGLHNRRYLYEQVEIAIALHKRHKDPFCLLVMDIDLFKAINDRYGHIFGDKVLISVAQVMKKRVRSSDILVRFGGEEFVIIFAKTGCQDGKALAERIREDIKALRWEANGELVQLTLSIGLHCLTFDDERSSFLTDRTTEQKLDIDQIIQCADSALYAAKANGRDQVVVYGKQTLNSNSNTVNR